MLDFFTAFSFSLLLTIIFAFRFSNWGKPGLLVAYFLVFFATEWIASRWLVPPDAFGPEIGLVCLALCIPFIGGRYLARYLEEESRP